MQGYQLSYRPIKLNVASKKGGGAPTPQVSQPTYTRAPVPLDPENKTIFVYGIDGSITQDILRSSFRDFGEITAIKLFVQKGFAFVEFTTHDQAQRVLDQLPTGAIIGNCTVKISWGKPPPSRPEGQSFDRPPYGQNQGGHGDYGRQNDNYAPPYPGPGAQQHQGGYQGNAPAGQHGGNQGNQGYGSNNQEEYNNYSGENSNAGNSSNNSGNNTEGNVPAPQPYETNESYQYQENEKQEGGGLKREREDEDGEQDSKKQRAEEAQLKEEVKSPEVKKETKEEVKTEEKTEAQ